MACPAACGDITLIRNPLTDCQLTTREDTLSRIAFFDCNTTLPDPITGAAMKALFDNGTIVVSSKLANITWDDPATEDYVISECDPAQQRIVGRTMNFEDRFAISSVTGSPAVTDPYFDYKFWQDKIDNQAVVNYLLIYCNGNVRFPRDRNGNPLGASINAFINYQKPQTQGGQWMEFKRGIIRFAGDPLAFHTATPIFNHSDAGINF